MWSFWVGASGVGPGLYAGSPAVPGHEPASQCEVGESKVHGRRGK